MFKSIKKHARFILSSIVLIGLLIVLSFSWGGLPPIGKILDPVTGIYSGGQGEESNGEVKIEGLKNEVSIFYDERAIPHIFAKNDHDLYCAQGFTEASDRYWQMEFMAFTASGRLSEILGEDYLAYDREIRRKGILSSAKKSLKLIEQDKDTHDALLAYTKGVNAYLATIDVRSMPLEYKLLNYMPKEWTPLHSVLIMKLTGQNLSGYEKDVPMTRLYNELGDEAFNHLFPEELFDKEGIATLNSNLVSKLTTKQELEWATSYAGIGSNAWAVEGAKSQSGNPILCMDPHLNLSYPSFWYEIQLKSTDQNVYGASIPGVPGVIMGFNQNISFCTTNGQSDVFDWYLLDTEGSNDSYLLDGKRTSFKKKTEVFKIKGGGEFVDTIKYAIQGPVVFEGDFNGDLNHLNMALNWELQRESNDIRTFLKLNKAKNKADFVEAVKGYSCPSQNFIYGDKTNKIAYMHQGRLKKNRVGNGMFVIDGSKTKYFVTNYIDQSLLPFIENPASGFVYSTNQKPDLSGGKKVSYGYYSNVRHRRLIELLSTSKQLSVSDMKRFQVDNLNVFAREALPLLIKVLSKSDSKNVGKEELNALKQWNYCFDSDQKAPLIFKILWQEVEKNMYSKFSNQDVIPEQYRNLELINSYDSVGMGAHHWSSFNSLDELVGSAFTETIDSLKELQTYYDETLTWGAVNLISIGHMTNLGVFGDYHLKSNGDKNVLNAIHGNWGPSWRMIVEMGDEISAFGVYPGGQQGDPRNKKYNAFTKTWYDGKYYKLTAYKSIKEASSKSKRTIKLNGKN